MIAATLKKTYIAVPAILIAAAPAILLVALAGIAPQLTAILLWDVSEFASNIRIFDGFSLAAAAAVASVLFCSGVVSGLSGFAFSAVAACIIWLLPPLQAIPLIMLCSACNQLLSIGKLRREMVIRRTAEREGALPYIIGGLAGVPLGVEMLRNLPTAWFAAALGAFLLVYGAAMLLKPDTLRIDMSGWKAAASVGVFGGIIGGFSGFGASMIIAYLGLRGLGRSATRGITQPCILVMQLVSLGILAVTDRTIFDARFWLLWALTLPAVLLGTSAGVTLYRRLSEVNFGRAVLLLLMLSGASLLAKAMI